MLAAAASTVSSFLLLVLAICWLVVVGHLVDDDGTLCLSPQCPDGLCDGLRCQR